MPDFPLKKRATEIIPAYFIKITIDFMSFLEYHYNRYSLFDTKHLKSVGSASGIPGAAPQKAVPHVFCESFYRRIDETYG